MSVKVRTADGDAIREAAQILARGGLVAFPTETVYGLGVDATNGDAVARLFAVKQRPSINPLIIHVRDFASAERVAFFHPLAWRLAERFWPGALTLVLPLKRDAGISLLANAGLETVALRVPSHPTAQRLLALSELAIAAPSANPSGRISPTRAAHVAGDLGEKIDLLIDDGPSALGIESTVTGFEGNRAVLLRAGAIGRDVIEPITGPTALPCFGNRPSAPGQLASHYSPRAQLRLEARSVSKQEALLAFGPDVPPGGVQTLNLSARANLAEAAANLFAMIRCLDASGTRTIAVMPIPREGLGEAINDRLERAAAPREPLS